MTQTAFNDNAAQLTARESLDLQSAPYLDLETLDNVMEKETIKDRLSGALIAISSFAPYGRQYPTIAGMMQDGQLKSYIGKFLEEEILPALPPSDVNKDALYDEFMARLSDFRIHSYCKDHLYHASEKLASTLAPTLAHHLWNDGPIQHASFALALWYRCIADSNISVNRDITDPQKETLRYRLANMPDNGLPVLSLEGVDKLILGHPRLDQELNRQLSILHHEGPDRTLLSELNGSFLKPRWVASADFDT